MHQAEGVGNIRVYEPEVLTSLHVRGELVTQREILFAYLKDQRLVLGYFFNLSS